MECPEEAPLKNTENKQCVQSCSTAFSEDGYCVEQCQSISFIQITQNACYTDGCPISTFNQAGSKICQDCYFGCATCFGIRMNVQAVFQDSFQINKIHVVILAIQNQMQLKIGSMEDVFNFVLQILFYNYQTMVTLLVKKLVQNIIILIFVFHIVHLRLIKMDMLVLAVLPLVQFVLEILLTNAINVILDIIYTKQLVILYVQMKILMEILLIILVFQFVQIFYIYLKSYALIFVHTFYIDMKLQIQNYVLMNVFQNLIYKINNVLNVIQFVQNVLDLLMEIVYNVNFLIFLMDKLVNLFVQHFMIQQTISVKQLVLLIQQSKIYTVNLNVIKIIYYSTRSVNYMNMSILQINNYTKQQEQGLNKKINGIQSKQMCGFEIVLKLTDFLESVDEIPILMKGISKISLQKKGFLLYMDKIVQLNVLNLLTQKTIHVMIVIYIVYHVLGQPFHSATLVQKDFILMVKLVSKNVMIFITKMKKFVLKIVGLCQQLKILNSVFNNVLLVTQLVNKNVLSQLRMDFTQIITYAIVDLFKIICFLSEFNFLLIF